MMSTSEKSKFSRSPNSTSVNSLNCTEMVANLVLAVKVEFLAQSTDQKATNPLSKSPFSWRNVLPSSWTDIWDSVKAVAPIKKTSKKISISFHLIFKLVLLNGCFDCFLSKVFLDHIVDIFPSISRFFSVRGF
jgi:hypothetical protein